jgi:hypothetical protein
MENQPYHFFSGKPLSPLLPLVLDLLSSPFPPADQTSPPALLAFCASVPTMETDPCLSASVLSSYVIYQPHPKPGNADPAAAVGLLVAALARPPPPPLCAVTCGCSLELVSLSLSLPHYRYWS